MEDLSEYFDQRLVAEFAASVASLRENFGVKPTDDWGTEYGVGGNTFRALTGLPSMPSLTYRAWASMRVRKLDVSALESAVRDRERFLKWHEALVASLQRRWVRDMGQPLSFAHSRKLIDLFVKWLTHFDLGSPQVTKLLVENANCALDRQTLKMLNQCLSCALPMSKPSMGDIQSAFTYQFCQAAITEVAVAANGTRLLFDAFTWKAGG